MSCVFFIFKDPMILHSYGTLARQIATNPVYHGCMKYVGVDCYFIWEKIETKEIKIKYIHWWAIDKFPFQEENYHMHCLSWA